MGYNKLETWSLSHSHQMECNWDKATMYKTFRHIIFATTITVVDYPRLCIYSYVFVCMYTLCMDVCSRWSSHENNFYFLILIDGDGSRPNLGSTRVLTSRAWFELEPSWAQSHSSWARLSSALLGLAQALLRPKPNSYFIFFKRKPDFFYRPVRLWLGLPNSGSL